MTRPTPTKTDPATFSEVPQLETDRLILRAMSFTDWPDYCAMMMSERAVHMGGPFTLAGAWGMFCADAAQWSLFGFGALMIDEKSTGRCVGQVGINDGPLFPEQELGWLLYAGAEGHGIATEAARAMRQWAFDMRGLKTLVSYIAPENHRSINLARRLGALPDHDARRPDPDDIVFRHPVS